MIRLFPANLAVRLSLFVSAIAICVVAIVLAAVVYYSYRLQIHAVEHQIEEVERVSVPTLTTDVWDYADESVREQIAALSGLRHVSAVGLFTPEDTLRLGRTVGSHAMSGEFTLTHPLGGELGRLHIEFDPASVRSAVARETLAVSGYVLGPFLIMTVATLLVFRRLVTRHLLALANYSRGLTVDTLDQGFEFQRTPPAQPDELDRLLDSLNAMRTNLRSEIEDRKLAEQRLFETESRYQEIYDSTGDAIFIMDADTGAILDVNRAMLEMYQVDRTTARARTVADFSGGIFPYNQEEAIRHVHLARQGEPQIFEWLARRSNGETFWVEVYLKRMVSSDRPLILAAVRDISSRKAAEQDLIQFQKMESIGQLAGGIAHDFNNLLAGIMGSAELLNLQLKDPEDLELVRMITDTSQRAAELTGRLLAFSRKAVVVAGPVDLHEVVTDVATMLRHGIDRRIVLDLDLAAVPAMISGDRSQLQNAILNLALNARDAMPDGGTLTLHTGRRDLDEAFCDASPFPLSPGTHLALTVTDTGIGISPEIQAHIFDPFFTTKQAGKGTGLGLATVYGTVKDHNGAVTLSSEPGQGTTFTLLLPAADEPVAAAETPAHPVRTGSGRILLVDDEDMVRSTAQRMLETLGYRVICARDGAEGVEIFKAQREDIDLVVLDMIMPVMSGQEAFRAMRAIDPTARILVASGFSHHDALTAMLNEGVQGFLRKPFRRTDLGSVVANALEN